MQRKKILPKEKKSIYKKSCSYLYLSICTPLPSHPFTLTWPSLHPYLVTPSPLLNHPCSIPSLPCTSPPPHLPSHPLTTLRQVNSNQPGVAHLYSIQIRDDNYRLERIPPPPSVHIPPLTFRPHLEHRQVRCVERRGKVER